jgi:centractin
VLFSPELIGEESVGVHDQLMYSITKSDMDLRRTLWANISGSRAATP